MILGFGAVPHFLKAFAPMGAVLTPANSPSAAVPSSTP